MRYKKILAALLAAAAVTTAVPCFAVTAGAKSATVLSASDFEEIESFSNSDSSAETQDTTLPSSIDLREKGVVTPVKLQNPFGNCWAFATMAAAETSILSESGKTYKDTKLDLSEKHLSWFANTYLNDPTSSQNGEGIHFVNSVTSSAHMDNSSSSLLWGAAMFSSGIGPVYENDYPYKGKNGNISYSQNASGSFYKLSYSKDDDWSISESERFKSEYALEEGSILPKIVETETKTKEDGTTYKVVTGYDTDTLNDVKKELNEGRAVAVMYYADQSADSKYMNKTNWCQYMNTPTVYDHAVCIVGYDDNYSRENFNEGCQPPADGAFLIKNSWGSDTEEFPNSSPTGFGLTDSEGRHTGYFWLSYYDATIGGFADYDFDVTGSKKDETIIDQYDFASYNTADTYVTQKDCSMANIFTASQHQQLEDVSCITSTEDTTVYYNVYLIDDDNNETLVSSKAVTYEYGGYHREELTKSVELSKGQKYKIQVTLVNPDNKTEVILPYLYANQDTTTLGKDTMFGRTTVYSKAVVNKGESALCYDGEWIDWKYARTSLSGEDSNGLNFDNFPIKGYSKPLAEQTVTVTVKNSSLVYNGRMQTPTVTLKDYRGSTIPASEYTVGTHKNAGTYKVSITFKNDKYKNYTLKTASYKITKAPTTISKGTTSKTFKSNIFGVTAKAKSFSINAKATRLGNKSSVTYTKVSGNKKITVSKTGKVTVAKGTKTGTYKVKVKLSKAATANFKAATKTITLTIKVK